MPVPPGHRGLHYPSFTSLIARALAFSFTVSGIGSIFADWVSWSGFLSILVAFYRGLVYPLYDLIAAWLHIPIPSLARDVYSICYSLAACMLLARGFGSAPAVLANLIWQSTATQAPAPRQRHWARRIAVALVGALLLALLAPAMFMLLFLHPGGRSWGWGALRLYGWAIASFFLLAAFNFHLEQWLQHKEGLAQWVVPWLSQPIVQWVAVANAIAIATALLLVGLARWIKARSPSCVLDLTRQAKYDVVGKDGLLVLLSDQPLAARVRYASPRLNGELEIFLSQRTYVRQGRPPEPLQRQAAFIATRLVVIDFADESPFCAAIVPVLQRHPLVGHLSRAARLKAAPPVMAMSIAELNELEPRVREWVNQASLAF
jgi:hypothetical protein